MADFVAVIRRAVDGLSDNTPVLRAKVYDKARGAVLRQLESMKPRPPEEMLRRQLHKLEAAIIEVEAEHAEALPPIAEPETIVAEAVAMEVIDTRQGEAMAAPVQQGAGQGAFVAEQSEPEQASGSSVQPAEPVSPTRWDAVATAPSGPEAHYSAAVERAAPALAVSTPISATSPVRPAAPAPGGAYLWGDESWAGEDEGAVPEPANVAPSYALPDHDSPAPKPESWTAPVAADPVAETVIPPEPVSPVSAEPDRPAWEPEPDFASAQADEKVEADPWQEPEPAAAGSVPADEADADFPIDDPAETYRQMPVETVDAAAGPIVAMAGPIVAMAGPIDAMAGADSTDLSWPEHPLDRPHAAARHEDLSVAETVEQIPEQAVESHGDAGAPEPEEHDPFSWIPDEPAQTPEPHRDAVAEPEGLARRNPAFDVAPTQEPHRPSPADLIPLDEPEHDDLAPGDPVWDESPFTDVPLPGGDAPERPLHGRKAEEPDWDQGGDFGDYAGEDKPEDDHSFLFTPVDKPARSYRIEPKRRMDFTSIGLGLLGLLLVAGSGYGAWVFRDTLSGLVTGLVSSPPVQETKGTVPVPATSGAGTPSATPAATSTAKPATPDTAAGNEPDIQKFTQRLKNDGSEVDAGKADGTGDGEGKSVAQQNVASAAPVDPAKPVTSGGTQVTPGVTQVPAAAIPVGVSQKLYLYEERVGQTSPVAIEGGVVWSLKHELADNGKNEAIVQAQVTAPGRGLSALISFKRNLDPSLPASHLVELVFSLPKDFDGGAIESVQRVAMKQTEQDRGDPLIAVPAKITDDFHMIALNDYADAQKFNLNLLKTRNWIDIPLTYRNGRRALLTMEKGAAGAEAFNQAISEWATDAPPAAAAAPANPG